MLDAHEFIIALYLFKNKELLKLIWPKDNDGNFLSLYCPYIPLQGIDENRPIINYRYKSRYE